jgi:hypothetical protein
MLGESEGRQEGIIGRAVNMLFTAKNEIEVQSRNESTVSLSVELLEVYNEQVRDLLAPKAGPNGKDINLKVTSKEVIGNIRVQTNSTEDVKKVMALAQKRRCVKATASNAESSRSHMLFTIHFEVSTKEGTRQGKLNVCDLAGSERLKKSNTHAAGVSAHWHSYILLFTITNKKLANAFSGSAFERNPKHQYVALGLVECD